MKTVMTLALAAACVTQPLVAHAGKSCGGGGGGGGGGGSSGGSGGSSGGGGDSSSSSSDSGGGSAAVPACVDGSDVVGYRFCSKYGDRWAMRAQPRFFLELGTNVRQFSGSTANGRVGTVWHGAEQFAYRMVTPSGGDAGATAVATSLRLGFGVTRNLYAGVEGELGGLTSSPAQVEMMSSGVFGTPETSANTSMLMSGTGFVGARVASGRASLSIEGAGGVRNVRYSTQSTYHDCVDNAVINVARPVLEARARAEVWLNPWFTLGAQAGANVAAQGDWMTGLYLGVHSRAFGGGR